MLLESLLGKQVGEVVSAEMGKGLLVSVVLMNVSDGVFSFRGKIVSADGMTQEKKEEVKKNLAESFTFEMPIPQKIEVQHMKKNPKKK